VGHLKHFAGPSFGPGALGVILAIFISPVIFTIEVISEIMKNVSLSLRLFGNISGGHEAVLAMDKLGGQWVPFGAFLMPIKLLTCVVQALIFSLLTCVYISLVTHHEHEGGHHEVEAAH
jgi:F-type H+-transporting ATPase subunit a